VHDRVRTAAQAMSVHAEGTESCRDPSEAHDQRRTSYAPARSVGALALLRSLRWPIERDRWFTREGNFGGKRHVECILRCAVPG
jgi:hypothetical protein